MYRLYVGTYTQKLPYVHGKGEGIYHLTMDARTGELSEPALACKTTNPSFLALHPNNKWLYAANELMSWRGKPGGALSAFAIQPGGSLRLINQRASGGAAPCYASLDAAGQVLLAANYASGTVGLLPIQPDGSLGRLHSRRVHQGSGPDSSRQEAPHAHSIRMDRSNTWALAADLGIDQLVIYRVANGRLMLHTQAALHPGAGPRHFDFNPDGKTIYVANELDSTVTVLRFDPGTAACEPLQTISTLPAGFSGANTAADIHLHPDGRTLYVSNRGHDSLAIFQVAANGSLQPSGNQPTLGRTPRSFTLTPDGKFLLVVNQDSDALVVFAIDKESGTLQPTTFQTQIPTPVAVVVFPDRLRRKKGL